MYCKHLVNKNFSFQIQVSVNFLASENICCFVCVCVCY